MTIRGQWLGSFTGTNAGRITINIDEGESNFFGKALLHHNIPPAPQLTLPVAHVQFETANKNLSGTFQNVKLTHFHPETYETLNQQQLVERHPGFLFPDNAMVAYAVANNRLDLSWITPVGSQGAAQIQASKAGDPSEIVGQQIDWNGFKQAIGNEPYRKIIFRGQQHPSRLRTAFHRLGRADLERFTVEDMQALHHAFAGRTKHQYNREIGEHNGALLHLAQHHGYPTPLLDWTYSPYVAAFFALRSLPTPSDPGHRIRIFAFDVVQWKADWEPILAISAPRLHISVLEAVPFDNERAGPQQALSLVTNIDDVETYIRFREQDGKVYLRAYDVLVDDKQAMIADLNRMGISAASMFPGLDGVCEDLKARRFPYYPPTQ